MREEPNFAIIHLLIDHKVMREILNRLELELRRFEEKGEISMSFMLSFINFSRKFLDRCHRNKEEKCLFPVLENLGVRREGGPIGVMLMEHKEIERLISEIESRLNEYSNNKASAPKLIEACHELLNLVHSHFFKEEAVLFKTGVEIMSKEESNKTVACYEGIEKEIDHEKLMKEAEELKRASFSV